MPKVALTYMDVFTNTKGDEAKDALSKTALKAWETYKAAREAAKGPQKAFEETFIAEARKAKALGENETLRFGYNFGKLAVAKVAAEGAKSKPGRFKITG